MLKCESCCYRCSCQVVWLPLLRGGAAQNGPHVAAGRSQELTLMHREAPCIAAGLVESDYAACRLGPEAQEAAAAPEKTRKEVVELTSNAEMEQQCTASAGLCLIALLDVQADSFADQLQDLKAAAEHMTAAPIHFM